MPATSPTTEAETRAAGPGEIAIRPARESGSSDAPEFVLLDASGPRPAALVLSFGSLIGLLALTITLARPPSATPTARGKMVSEVFIPREPRWLRSVSPLQKPSTGRAPRSELAELADPAESTAPGPPVRESPPAPAPGPPVEAGARANPLAVVLPKAELSVLPLASSDGSRALKLMPVVPGATQVIAGSAHSPAADVLGTLPLPRLIEHEAALAASLAALRSDQRLALPRVSIRVNAEWLEALPQTQEKLYFSFTTPQAGTEVLAYSPATRSFTFERPLRPLWQIRESERVPQLAVLRSAAARWLGVPPELVGLYTWHPAVLEEALRMFVVQRMEQMGMQLGPRDLVTVRIASGPGGFVMNLEPIRGGASW